MIQRVKVCYSIRDLWQSFFISKSESFYLNQVAKRFESYFGRGQALLTQSGRGALYVALKSLPQPVVVCSAFTCKAVIEAILLAGKKVIFCDVDNDSWNTSFAEILKAAPDDSIIVHTHQYGIVNPLLGEDMVAAHQRRIVVVEDVAAGLGIQQDGVFCGTQGDISFFSFESTKLLHSPVRGGLLMVNNPSLWGGICKEFRQELLPLPQRFHLRFVLSGLIFKVLEAPLLYRVFYFLFFKIRGKLSSDSADEKVEKNLMFSYQMAEWQARVLDRQLSELSGILVQKRRVVEHYHQALGTFAGVVLDRKSAPPLRYSILVPNKEEFAKFCALRGVDLGFSFTHIWGGAETDCPKAYELARRVVNLPCYPQMTEGQLNKVVATVKEYFRDQKNY